MKIDGKNIYLTSGLSEQNHPRLLEGFHDLETMRYVGFVKRARVIADLEALRDFLAELADAKFFEIYTHTDDRWIGYTSLAHFDGNEQCEFGIFIMDKNYRGRGVGEEVSRLMLKYAFEELGMKKIVLTTAELHEHAIELYEKIGFKKTNHIPDDRTVYHNDKWITCGTVKMEISKT